MVSELLREEKLSRGSSGGVSSLAPGRIRLIKAADCLKPSRYFAPSAGRTLFSSRMMYQFTSRVDAGTSGWLDLMSSPRRLRMDESSNESGSLNQKLLSRPVE